MNVSPIREHPMPKTNFLTAIRDAMAEEMRSDPRVFLMGEDVELNLFGSSKGLRDEFGADRVRDVPLSEATVVGAAAGAAMVGTRPIVDLTISPFLYPAADQIISIIAKARYMYGGQTHVPLVIRSCMFYNINNAAQHSDRPYSLFMSIPGLKIVVPSDAHDAKGLLISAIRDPDPVMFFEDVNLWGSTSDIPAEHYAIPLGKAVIKRAGTDVTVVAVGATVSMALKAADLLQHDGISVEVIDPRTIKPLDTATVLASVSRTGRLVAVDPAHRTGSVASEISATITEYAFDKLKAPILRVTAPDVHIPFAGSMEKALFPTMDAIVRAVRSNMSQTKPGQTLREHCTNPGR
jgi:acetoin:2,6-dichlorophenolindophenol oxidoreductase subunit beta